MTRLKYTVSFTTQCKNDTFQMKSHCDILLISAQYKDCRYTLEPPHGVSHNFLFFF